MSDREEFEKWYDETTNCNYGVAYYVDVTGRYCHHDIEIAWRAWQAARAAVRKEAPMTFPEYGKRYQQILADLPFCPMCKTPQVQVTNYLVSPARWKCRECGHRFEYEPKEID